jgi:plastocyanin
VIAQAVVHQHGGAEPAPPALVRTAGITDAAYVPVSLVVPPGASITWHNDGHNRHTVTEDDGLFNSGALNPGQRFTISAPSAPGVYRYHCIFHSYIRGTLTVSLVGLDTPAPVAHGETARLAGTVPGAAEGTPVTIEQRVPGAWVVVATPTTDASGTFSARTGPLTARTAFRALTGGSISPSVRAEVHPHLHAHRSGRAVRVELDPAVAGAMVALERLDLDTYRWSEVRHLRLGGAGRTRFRLARAGVYRVSVEPGHGLSAATSAPIQFRPARFHE